MGESSIDLANSSATARESGDCKNNPGFEQDSGGERVPLSPDSTQVER